MSDSYHLEDEVEQKAYDHRLMRRLLQYVRPYRSWLIVATVLLLIAAGLTNVLPLAVMWSVDHYINNPDRAPGDSAQLAQDIGSLFDITMLIAVLVLIETVVRYGQLVIVAVVGQRTMLHMRTGLFAHLQQMPLRFLDRNPVGRLMSRVTNDIEKIQQTIVSGTVEVLGELLTVIVVLGFMFVINWQLALLALLPLPFIFLTSYLFRKFARGAFLEIRQRIASINAHLQENVSGMRIAQLFGAEGRQYAAYERRNAQHRDAWFTQIRNFAVYYPVIEFLGTAAVALIIGYTGLRYLQLGETVTGLASEGTFFAYVFWAERLYGPIRALADRYNLLLEAMAASERVFQLQDTQPEIVDAPDAKPLTNARGAIDFEDVWFAYDEANWVLKGVSFSVAPGERIAIVGHTGAGKTTIINVLGRFYDVQRGAVRIDGDDVRALQQETLRRNIGIVLQDVFLFSGTIEDNIRLGDRQMSFEHVQRCAQYVNAHPFIEQLPGGYQFNVGERGVNLSTGQRQLIAFARTLAHDPRILVLDEATSSIDTATEVLIQDAIEKLLAGRTALVIAHRLSTIRNADRILVMHHGELREQGTHDELLAVDGLYRKLYTLQYLDESAA